MIRLPAKLRTLLLLLLGLYISTVLYLRSGNYSSGFLTKYTGSELSLTQEVPDTTDSTVKHKPRSLSSTYEEPKYPSIDPELYGDFWKFPLEPFHMPGDAEAMAEHKCADVFGARYTSYCDDTSELIARKMARRNHESGGRILNGTTSLKKRKRNINAVEDESLIHYKQDFLQEYCPCYPSTLIGRQNVSGTIPEESESKSFYHEDRKKKEDIVASPDMEPVLPGGRWAPKDCRARQRVAVIIPFRDRHSHLEKLLSHLHPMLQRQQIDYAIFVIEQNKPDLIFNKGMLMNSGFMEIHGEKGIRRDNRPNSTLPPFVDDTAGDTNATLVDANSASNVKTKRLKRFANDTASNDTRDTQVDQEESKQGKDNSMILGPALWGNFDCYIYHDVDMLPEDDRNMYTCTKTPRHVGVYISKYNYTICCGALFGGATAYTAQHYISLNGYSNEYYGWGGEDDDMIFRMRWQKMPWVSYPRCMSRYTMIRHRRDRRNWENPNRVIAVRSRPKVYEQVGLSSVTYDLVKAELRPLYTWLLFDLPDSIQLPDGSIVPRFEKTKTGRLIRIA